MKLVFATNNRHKLDEVRAIVGDRVEVLSLNDIECHDEIPETADTLQGLLCINSLQARALWALSMSPRTPTTQ